MKLAKERAAVAFISVFFLAIMLVVVGCSNTAAPDANSDTDTPGVAETMDPEEVYTIRVASVHARPIHTWDTMDYWEELLTEQSNGQIVMEKFEGGSLGGETEVLERLQMNTFECYMGSSGPFAALTGNNLFLALDLPYVFTSWDHFYRAIEDGEYGDAITETLLDQGLRVLGWGSGGTRLCYYNGPDIIEPSDMKGLIIRTMENESYQMFYGLCGAQATPMSWTEVYTGLQMGTIDGCDSSMGGGAGAKHNEVVDHVLPLDHVYAAYAITVSEEWYQSLPANIQDILVRTGKEAGIKMRELYLEQDAEYRNAFEESGAKVMDDFNKDAFIEIGEEVTAKFADKVGQEYLDMIKAAE